MAKGNIAKNGTVGNNKSTTSITSVKSTRSKVSTTTPMNTRSVSGQSGRSVNSVTTRPVRPISAVSKPASKPASTKPATASINTANSTNTTVSSQIPRPLKTAKSSTASTIPGRPRPSTTVGITAAAARAALPTRPASNVETATARPSSTTTNSILITPPHSSSETGKSALSSSNPSTPRKAISTGRPALHRRQGSQPNDLSDNTLSSALAIARRNAANGPSVSAVRTASPTLPHRRIARKPPNLKIDVEHQLAVNGQSMSRQGSEDRRPTSVGTVSSRSTARPRPLRALSGHPTLSPDNSERQPKSPFRFKTPPATPTSSRSFPAVDPFSDGESAPGEFGKAIRNWSATVSAHPDETNTEANAANRYTEPPEYERVARVFGWRGGVLATTGNNLDESKTGHDVDAQSNADTVSTRRRRRNSRRKDIRTDTEDADTERDDAEPTDGDASDNGMAKSILKRLRRRATSRLSEFEADQRLQRARSPSNAETDDDLLADASFRSDGTDALISDNEHTSPQEHRAVSPASKHSENRWRWPRSLTKSQHFDREAGATSPGPSSFPSLPDLHRAKSTRQLPDTTTGQRLGSTMEQRSSSVGHQRRKLSVSVVQYDPMPASASAMHDLVPPVPAIPPEYLPGGGVAAASMSAIAQQRLERKTHRRTTSQTSRGSRYSAPSVDLDREDDMLLLDPTIFDRIQEDDLQSVWADVTLSESNTATNSRISGSIKQHGRVASVTASSNASSTGTTSANGRRASLNDMSERVTRPSLTSDRVSFTSVDPAQMGSLKRFLVAATPEKMVYILTTQMDYTFMMDFFFTYRSFMTPLALCQLLVARFRWALTQPQSEDVERRVVRIRLYVVLRHWLLDHYTADFHKSRPVRRHLARFLDTLPEHPVIQASQRDHRIMQQLRRLFRRLRMYHRRSARTHAPVNGDLLVLRNMMNEEHNNNNNNNNANSNGNSNNNSKNNSYSSAILSAIQRPSNESTDATTTRHTTATTSIGPRQRPQLYDMPAAANVTTITMEPDTTRYVYAGTFLLPPLAFKVLPPLPVKQLPSLPFEQYDKKPLPNLPQDEERLAASTAYSSSGNSDDDDSFRRRRGPNYRRHRHMPSITSGLASDVCSITSVESRAGPDGLSPKMPKRQALQRPMSTPSLHRFLTGNYSNTNITGHKRYRSHEHPSPVRNATTRVFRLGETIPSNARHTFPKRKQSRLAIVIDDTEPGAWRRTMTTALLGEVARVKRGVAGSVKARMRKRPSSIEICNCIWPESAEQHANNTEQEQQTSSRAGLHNETANQSELLEENSYYNNNNKNDNEEDIISGETVECTNQTVVKSFNPRRISRRLFKSDTDTACQSDSAVTSTIRSPLRRQINMEADSTSSKEDINHKHTSKMSPSLSEGYEYPKDAINEDVNQSMNSKESIHQSTNTVEPNQQPNTPLTRTLSRRHRPRRPSRLSATALAARDTLRRARGSLRNHRLGLRRRVSRSQTATTCPTCCCLMPMGSQEEIEAVRRRWRDSNSNDMSELSGSILEYRSEMVAVACCVIESEVLRAIHWRDLLNVSWNRSPTSAGDRTSGVRRLIDRFNSVSI
ncbi:hypothetical protein BDF19DRAFT_142563 [Syncephalis fuscata]|nr:hypothetical protein BDF19DRAFT_142563 [Syncephalis fuscata]